MLLYVVLVDYLFYVKYEFIYFKFLDGFRILKSCDGLVRFGFYVFVDINKIGCLCICIVNLLFVGVIFVILFGVII